jgi:Zn-dependent peptidase ImmA (M78 family)
MEALKVGSRDRRTLEAIAASLRRRADQLEPAFSTRQIIDSCFPGTVVTGRSLPRGVHDLVCVDAGAFRSHRAPHVIMYARDLPTADQRYAIAHALAHIIFDGGQADCGARNSDRELRCDRFADALLCPLDRLDEYVCAFPSKEIEAQGIYLDQVDQIASHFHVPQRVVDLRIRELPRFVRI